MKERAVVLFRKPQEIETKMTGELNPRVEILGTRSELAMFKGLGWDGSPSRQTR